MSSLFDADLCRLLHAGLGLLHSCRMAAHTSLITLVPRPPAFTPESRAGTPAGTPDGGLRTSTTLQLMLLLPGPHSY